MSAESTPSEAYHAEVRAYLSGRLTEMKPATEASSEYSSQDDGEQVDGAAAGMLSGPSGTERREDNSIAELVSPSVESPSAYICGPEWRAFSGNENENRYLRLRCSAALTMFNSQPLSVSMQERVKAWNDLVHAQPGDVLQSSMKEAPLVKSPIYVDYGVNIRIAPTAYVHRNVYLGDNPHSEAPITIGDGTIIGPGVQILSVKHELDWRHRHGWNGPSWAARVTVGNDCYIGAGAMIMPGCDIGDGCVIGAGSVVTRPIPAYHVAIGSPARPVRKVALDVPDAPSLQYEQRRGQMLVVRKRSEMWNRAALIDRPSLEDHTRAISTQHMWQFRTLSRRRSSMQDLSFLDGSNTDRGTEHQRLEVLRLANPDAEKRVGVDVVLLVASVLIGWMVVHAVLY